MRISEPLRDFPVICIPAWAYVNGEPPADVKALMKVGYMPIRVQGDRVYFPDNQPSLNEQRAEQQ
jgi:hypothetical protein